MLYGISRKIMKQFMEQRFLSKLIFVFCCHSKRIKDLKVMRRDLKLSVITYIVCYTQ